MPNCNCAGSTCSCLVTGGNGVQVTGTGTKSAPYVIELSLSTLQVGNLVAVTNSSTIEFGKHGSGALNDPTVISGDVVLHSPDGTRWAPSISNSGVVTWGPAGPAQTGSSGSGGSVILSNDILYWNGTSWDTRSTTLTHAVWISLGYTGVPTPPGFKQGDSWLCEAS